MVVRIADVADLVRSRADSRVAVSGVFGGGDCGWDSVELGCFVAICQSMRITDRCLHGRVSNVEVRS